MKPELYFDRRSPPVRSVLLLIEALGIEVDHKPIDLAKGEHRSDSFVKVTFTVYFILMSRIMRDDVVYIRSFLKFNWIKNY